jgi:peptidoglycan/xylan/chitin deacetylase (PgdA/CDA1 family)
MTLATIVMYHVVQPAGAGVVARLKGRDIREFAEQVEYIRRYYTPVPLLDLAAACSGAITLPPRAIALTFDDGYASHSRIVAPMLADAGMPATFFLVASALIDRAVLNVNRIQCILAAADTGALVERINAAIEGDGDRTVAAYRREWFTPSRWDTADVAYVKRLLQHAMPDRIREPLVEHLFHTYVTADERALADELYMTTAEARELVRMGMTIGAHADRHVRLTTLSREGQAGEIDGALRVLDAAGVPRKRFAYSYANGEFNDDSVDLLRARECALAVSTRPDLALIRSDALLSLPRLDTNDLPIRRDAEPNEWTRRAGPVENAS